MRVANKVIREVVHAQGQGIERQLEEFVYKSEKERRADKYAKEGQELWATDTKDGQRKEVGTQHLKASFKSNQLLTGHGNMEAYLQRFQLKQTDGQCACVEGLEEVQHIKEDCQLSERVQARDEIKRYSTGTSLYS